MMACHSPDLLLSLARMMIRQSRMLRDAGLRAEARELARRALVLDRLGWSGRASTAGG